MVAVITTDIKVSTNWSLHSFAFKRIVGVFSFGERKEMFIMKYLRNEKIQCIVLAVVGVISTIYFFQIFMNLSLIESWYISVTGYAFFFR